MRKIAKAEEPEKLVKRMNLNVPVDLHNSFKSITAAEGQNMTDVLLQFIHEYVDDHSLPKQQSKPKGRRR